MWRRFALPLCLLVAAAVLKRLGPTGQPISYAAAHGAWHIASAVAVFSCLYDEAEPS